MTETALNTSTRLSTSIEILIIENKKQKNPNYFDFSAIAENIFFSSIDS